MNIIKPLFKAHLAVTLILAPLAAAQDPSGTPQDSAVEQAAQMSSETNPGKFVHPQATPF